MGFCTLIDMKRLLQIEIPAEKIESAERAISVSTAAIQNYCEQELQISVDDTATFDGTRRTKLILPQIPVVNVTSVVEDDDTLTVTDDYILGANGYLHRISAYWAIGIQNITVTFTHGYRIPDDGLLVGSLLPNDVIDVCTRASVRIYQAGLRAASVSGVPGVAALSLGDYSVNYGSEQSSGAGEAVLGVSASPMLLRSEKEILDHYRDK